MTAALLLVGTVLAPSAQAEPVPPVPPAFAVTPVQWAPCDAERLAVAGVECGSVTVPLDHDDPQGATISIAVSRVVHTSPEADYQGVMLVNPGGPGGSGLSLALLGGTVPGGVGDTYDWIGFDPRGVGSSEPALSCIPDYAAGPRPDYRPEVGPEDAWLQRAEDYAQACAANGGPLLDHLTTVDNARDLDVVRQALGVEQINYYGFSYGTYLGQVYATLFPQNLRRVVFDGIVDEREVWYEANLNQDIAFERNIGEFFDWVARYDALYGLGTTGEEVEALYYAELDALAVSPVGTVGSAEWNDLFLGAGYNVNAYPGVAELFANWVQTRDAGELEGAYAAGADVTDDNGYAVYLATECTDAAWPTDWETWRADNTRVAAEAPFETWANAWFNAPCFFWEGAVAPEFDVDPSGLESALLISETNDGATPYSGALHARDLIPNSALVEGVGGFTHSASLSGIACTDDIVAAYLATGELPARVGGDSASDVQCEPLPQPDPVVPDSP